MKYKIFVYGTLKSENIQKELFGEVLKKYKAILKGYSMYEAEDGWYFIKKKTGSNIQGYVIELDDRCLEICDAFEDCPNMYQREKVTTIVENEEIETFVYVRTEKITNYKEVTKLESYSKFSEEFVINTEIKHFKEIEHPEFYKK